jgi:GNAT superfamily N-acetyltransferase
MIYRTKNLEIRRIDQNQEDLQPAELLPIFNTNPEWIDASFEFTGKSAVDTGYVEMMIWQESLREDSLLFSLRQEASVQLAGIMAAVVPAPGEGFAMIGVILLAKEFQGKGLGREALEFIEGVCRTRGFDELRASAMQAIPCHREFFEHCGYELIREGLDQNKRACWIFRRNLV